MGDVAQLNSEQESLRRIRARLLQWDAKDNPLAPLTHHQIDSIDLISEKWKELDQFHVRIWNISRFLSLQFHFRLHKSQKTF